MLFEVHGLAHMQSSHSCLAFAQTSKKISETGLVGYQLTCYGRNEDVGGVILGAVIVELCIHPNLIHKDRLH